MELPSLRELHLGKISSMEFEERLKSVRWKNTLEFIGEEGRMGTGVFQRLREKTRALLGYGFKRGRSDPLRLSPGAQAQAGMSAQ